MHIFEIIIIFSKYAQISNCTKICPVITELLHEDRRRTDGQTDRHEEANCLFSKFFRTRPKENYSFINSISTVNIGSYPIIESAVAINFS